jgi:hypothetical protein
VGFAVDPPCEDDPPDAVEALPDDADFAVDRSPVPPGPLALVVRVCAFDEDEDATRVCTVTFARRDPDRYGAGSTGRPPTRVSKCTWGPVASPVVPT